MLSSNLKPENRQKGSQRENGKRMVNYYGSFRTNYFKVNSREAFNEFMTHLEPGGDIKVFETNEADVVGFGSIEGWIPKYCQLDEDGYTDAVDETTCFDIELQKLIAPGDAVIIQEIRKDNLTDVEARACIITVDKIEWICLDDQANNLAAELLGNPKWQSKMGNQNGKPKWSINLKNRKERKA
jgi:hypothetical protein